jgi:hypothetical protein
MSDQEEDEPENFAPTLIEAKPAHLWALALRDLYHHGDLTKVVELLRRHVPLAEHQSEFFADLLDPSKAADQLWQVKVVKSGNLSRKIESFWERARVGNKVLAAEKAGEKKYLAVERIAKEINKSERYVWNAVALVENPMKFLESED